MPRYFLEVSYHGAGFSGFQKQQNANTVQREVETAFLTLQKEPVELTGSSRTDAGVHAKQNFFHFDFEPALHPQFLYKMNAILPREIVIVQVLPVAATSHCRFDALGRVYTYHLYARKDPFLQDRAYYFPYKIDFERMEVAAKIILQFQDFSTFSKRNSQVKTMICKVTESGWQMNGMEMVYQVSANRFLRGMVRGLTGTMLQVGRGKLSIEEFQNVLESKDPARAHFDVPAKGLFLEKVEYPDSYFSR